MDGRTRKNEFKFKEHDIVAKFLITSDGCPSCSEARRELRHDIRSGEMRVLDVGDDLGYAIVKALGLNEVPAIVFELRSGFPVKYVLSE